MGRLTMFVTETFLLCDNCTAVADDSNHSRRDLWGISKEQGWSKVNGEHLCPDCAKPKEEQQ